jgi:hypothetical protein
MAKQGVAREPDPLRRLRSGGRHCVPLKPSGNTSRDVSQLKDAIRPYFFTARRLVRRELRLTDIGYARKVSYSQFGEDLWLAEQARLMSRGWDE